MYNIIQFNIPATNATFVKLFMFGLSQRSIATLKLQSAIQIKLDMEAKFRTGTSNDLGESRGGSVGLRRGFDSVKE